MKRSSAARRRFVATAGLTALAAAFGEVLTGREVHADDGGDRDKFIRAVQKARIFDLSHLWDENSPIAAVNPGYSMALAATHANTKDDPRFDGRLSFAGEIQQFSGQHGAPSIDAIGHIGRDGKLFGEVNAFDATSDPRGIGRDAAATGAHLDIAHYPVSLLVNRGVLLDVARYVADVNKESNRLKPLNDNVDIDADLLHQTARHHGVKIKGGDTILIRTGWGQYFADPSMQSAYKGDFAAGVGLDGARYLVKQRARVVGNDTLTFERRPPVIGTTPGKDLEVFPVHQYLIPLNGVSIIENYFLEELSAAQEYEFLLVVPPLKIRGGTGSALRSFALAP